MPRLLRPALLAVLALSACHDVPPVFFSSDPPGARVLIDGADSGFVTPCRLKLADRDAIRADLELRGYRTATRMLHHQGYGKLVYWRDAAVHYNTWDFPLWLGIQDFILFYKDQSGPAPQRVFVRLRREADL